MIQPLDALRVVLPLVQRIPTRQLVADYDEEADVLYVSFHDPPAMPENCIEDDDGVITRYGKDGEIIGYTYLNASELLAQTRAA